MIGSVRRLFHDSLWYRLFLILALVLFLIRVGVHGVYLTTLYQPEAHADIFEGLEDDNTVMVPFDLEVYLTAARNVQLQKSIYPAPDFDDPMIYQYSPTFAWLISLFLWVPVPVLLSVISIVYIMGILGLFVLWMRVFNDFHLLKQRDTLIRLLPLWLLYSGFWSDLGYMNVYILICVLTTLLIYFVIQENLLPAVFVLVLILLIKPHFAFAAVIPIIFKRFRFFVRMVVGAVFGYFLISGITILIVGPDYGLDLYQAYYDFLIHLSSRFPYFAGGVNGLLGYNHSIKQVVNHYSSNAPWAHLVADIFKWVLLIPLLASLIEVFRKAEPEPIMKRPNLAISVAFLLYLGVFIWLDVVWELTFIIVVFIHLLSSEKQLLVRILMWVWFGLYALVDLWQLISLGLFGYDILAGGDFIRTDPYYYFPGLLVLLLIIYLVALSNLFRQVWQKQMDPISADSTA